MTEAKNRNSKKSSGFPGYVNTANVAVGQCRGSSDVTGRKTTTEQE